MIYVKMMSGENLSDGNNSKGFTLIEVENMNYIKFSRIGSNEETESTPAGSPVVTVFLNIDGSEKISWYPEGNTYVLNKLGQTIASFGHMEPLPFSNTWYGNKSKK